MADRDESGVVRLQARVDAVVGRARGVVRVELESGGGRFCASGAGEPAVVERDEHRAVGGCREVRLDGIHRGARVVVDLNRRGPGDPAIK